MPEEFYGQEWEEKMYQRLAPRIEQSVRAMFAGRGATFGQEKAFLEEKIDKLRREISLEAEGKRATLSEAERGRQFQSEEAQKGREFQTSEAEKARQYRTQEIDKARQFYELEDYATQGPQVIKTVIGEFTEEQIRNDHTILDDIAKASPGQAKVIAQNLRINWTGTSPKKDEVLKEEEKDRPQIEESPTTINQPTQEGQMRWDIDRSGRGEGRGGQKPVGFRGFEEARRADRGGAFQTQDVRPDFLKYEGNRSGFKQWFNDEINWILRNNPTLTKGQARQKVIDNPATYEKFALTSKFKTEIPTQWINWQKDESTFEGGGGYSRGGDTSRTGETTATESPEQKRFREQQEKDLETAKNKKQEPIVVKEERRPIDEGDIVTAAPGFKPYPTPAPVGQEILTQARTPFKFPKETSNYGYGDEVIKENVPQTNLPQSQGLFQTPETYLDRFKRRTNPRVNMGRGFYQYGGYERSV